METRIPVEHFQQLFEAAPGAFLVLRPDAPFTIVGVTDEYLRATLTRREQILGRPLFEVFPDNPGTPEAQSTSNLARSLKRVLATRAPDTMAVQRYDVPAAGGGFELRYWSPVNAPVLGPDGSILYIIHRVDNVTAYVQLSREHAQQRRASQRLSADRVRMEAEIVERSRELDRVNAALQAANDVLSEYAERAREQASNKDEFLAMLAHELRNPLAAISSALQLWELAPPDPARQRDLLGLCRRQVRNLTRLVDDLLEMSRIDRGAVELQRAPLDLREVLDSAALATRELFERQRVSLVLRPATEACPMLGDPTRLEQVLANLLANAAKYSEPGGQVVVALERYDEQDLPWARITVGDQGRGIPADKLEAIFDVFVQVDVAIDRSRGGLGIGLSLVRALVGLHGGRVRAHSDGLGRGSSFVVELPLSGAAAVSAAGAPTAPAGTTAAGGAARRIALVEDNADARHTLQQLLSAMGHTVVTASNGPEGLNLITTYLPDVAFVDIGLPGIDGFELARHARRLLGGHKLRLVALTGYSSSAVRNAATEAGFDLHLVKPCPPEQLAEAVSILD